MLVQSSGILEDFLTPVTHVVVLLAVDLHVDIEGVSVSEDLVAEVAGLEALARVDPHVVLEFLLLAEHHVADRTCLPLLPGVGPLVGVARPLKSVIIRAQLYIAKYCSPCH